MPVTDAELVVNVLALAIDRSRTVLFDIVAVPLDTLMPLINPAVLGVVLVVAFTMLAMVFPEMVAVPAPVFWMPTKVWAPPVEVELALMLFDVVVLPIVLLLIVLLPFDDERMPMKLVEFVEALAVVIDPMMLFWQLTTPAVVVIVIPLMLALLTWEVYIMDPVPSAAPMVLPNTVPMFASEERETRIPRKVPVPLLVQLMFWMVLPWILLGVPLAVLIVTAVKELLVPVALVQADPPHCADLPPMKFPDTVKPLLPDAVGLIFITV